MGNVIEKQIKPKNKKTSFISTQILRMIEAIIGTVAAPIIFWVLLAYTGVLGVSIFIVLIFGLTIRSIIKKRRICNLYD